MRPPSVRLVSDVTAGGCHGFPYSGIALRSVGAAVAEADLNNDPRLAKVGFSLTEVFPGDIAPAFIADVPSKICISLN